MTASPLDKATNLVVIITCMIVSGVALKDAFERRRAPAPLPASAEYQPGEILEPISGLEIGGQRSLLMVVRSTCRYCTESLPFYRRLREMRDQRFSDTKLVAVCIEDRTTCERYLSEHAFVPDALVSVVGRSFKVSATPTLMLVDQDRKVVSSWRGRLDAEGEKEVENAVHSNNS